MSTEILLGEDFQVNHELSTIRSVRDGSTIKVGDTGYTLPARLAPLNQHLGYSIIKKGNDDPLIRAKEH